MSSFLCEKCGATISDTPHGYVTGCDHYPLEQRKRVSTCPLNEISSLELVVDAAGREHVITERRRLKDGQ
jgi:hypothetical protein